jgi:phosphoribosylformylglycinamidine (FGAM) synthase-like enzyme
MTPIVARLELRRVPCDEPGMSPVEIWCNEAQERYVMAVSADRPAAFCSDLSARALRLLRCLAKRQKKNI